jgi:hypothetical protein
MNLELVTNLLQRNVPDFVNDQVKFWIDMAQEAIRRDEREKIMSYAEGLVGWDGIDYDAFIEGIKKGKHLK